LEGDKFAKIVAESKVFRLAVEELTMKLRTSQIGIYENRLKAVLAKAVAQWTALKVSF
jgi:hypothetical protein